MFVRKKTVKGRDYYYLVKSIRDGDTVRQECLEYIGPKIPSTTELKEIKRRHEK